MHNAMSSAKKGLKSLQTKLAATLVSMAMILAAALVSGVAAPAAVAVEGEAGSNATPNTVVDGSTINSWQDHLTTDGSKTTQNIGRIWTDKTVSNDDITLTHTDGSAPKTITKDGSDFLVGLSALSSTSNLETATNKPLDISLVLDLSGSMRREMVKYTKVYANTADIKDTGDEDDQRVQTYYTFDESGNLITLQWKRKPRALDRNRSYGWRDSDAKDDPKEGELSSSDRTNWYTPIKRDGDSAEGQRVQFYVANESGTTKIVALKKAVKSFIDEMAKQNEGITDKNLQHRIALVKFATTTSNEVGNDKFDAGSEWRNYTQIVKELTSNTDELKNAIGPDNNDEGLTTGGATAADWGFEKAKESLSAAHGGRENAQKVVIFFTDGEPNHDSGWDESVANSAIATSKGLKDSGTLVYSIGVFGNADPSIEPNGATATNFDKYMHGVSSNYKHASSLTNLGDRTQKDGKNANYYFASTSPEDLDQVFKDIAADIQHSAVGAPTNVTEGAQDTSGYITFTDQLGEYMKVDDFKNIVYADTVYGQTGKSTSGNVDTYVFSHEVTGNAVYPANGNLDDIKITVTRSNADDLKTGDKVEVKIPASLIPLRNFKVSKAADGLTTMSVDEAYPIRVFFGVSLKDDVADQIAAGTFTDTEYINTHKNADGTKVYFNSNAYSGKKSADDAVTIGDTTAVYEPASNNSFYYFTANTPVYKDAEYTQPVKKGDVLDKDATFYYKQTYVEQQNNGSAQEKTVSVAFKGSSFEVEQGHWDYDQDDQLYIKAGTPRLTRIYDFNSTKENNATQTAATYVNTDWDSYTSPKNMQAFLGNNGRLGKALPGTLAVSKTVNVGEGLGDYSSKEFTFSIKVNGMAENATLKAAVKTGDKLGDAFDLKFGQDSAATYNLKGGQTLYIYGIADGTNYEVTETSAGNGWTTASQNATGTIKSDVTSTAAFTNTYSVTPGTLLGNEYLKIQKDLQGRDWQQGEKFKFVLSAPEGTPMPDDAKKNSATGNLESIVDVENENVTNFGNIQYLEKGIYTYTIFERTPAAADQVKGTSYSREAYTVTVNVEDNGNGGLTVTPVMQLTTDADGNKVANPAPVADHVAKITNTFALKEADGDILIQKVLKNNSDSSHNLKADDFAFKLKALTDGAPMPTGEKDSEGYVTTRNIADGSALFGIKFNSVDHKGKEYEYELREDIPSGANEQNNYTLNGMHYDPTVYTVKISVDVAATGALHAEVKYYGSENSDTPLKDESGKDISRATFNNVYTPKELVLTGDTAIKGSKKLVGRDALGGEKFTFTLAAENDAAKNGLANDTIVFDDDKAATTMTKEVESAKNGVVNDFFFDDVTVKRPGTYVFTVTETNKDGKNGLTYDEHAAVVTVKVDDVDSVLTPTITYNNNVDKAPEAVKNETAKAAFENVYTSSLDYSTVGGLRITKKLTGRAMAAGEFKFTITGEQGTNTIAEDAEAKLADGDKTFANNSKAANIADSMNKLQGVKFTQDDAGKTYVYRVDEKLPVDETGADRTDEDKALVGFQYQGVTYDQSEYRVEIAINDNGEKNLTVTTTIRQVKDENGQEADKQIGSYASKDELVSIPFENVYKTKPVEVNTTSAEFGLKKVLDGRDWVDGDTFSFTLTNTQKPADVTEAPMPNNTDVEVKHADAKNEASFGFGKLTFDTTGTYKYEVRETVPESATNPNVSNGAKAYKDATDDEKAKTGWTLNGIKYDNHVATITIVISDPGNGQLAKTVTVTSGAFTNTYGTSVDFDDAVDFKLTKTLFGHDMISGQFKFDVMANATGAEGDDKYVSAEAAAKKIGINNGTTGTVDGAAGKAGVKVEMPAEGSSTPKLRFTHEDSGKTFSYTFTEQQPADGEDVATNDKGQKVKDGYTYDNTSYTMNITPTDEGSGSMSIAVTVTKKVGNGEPQPVNLEKGTDGKTVVRLDFENSYKAAPGTLTGATDLKGQKNINGPWTGDRAGFKFSIKQVANAEGDELGKDDPKAELPDNTEVTSDANGEFHFGDITFSKSGDYYFQVWESAGLGGNGWTNDTSKKIIKVTVSDNDNGTLTVTKDPSASSDLTFTNTYTQTESAAYTPTITKSVSGNSATAQQFGFTLEAADEATRDAIKNGSIKSDVLEGETTSETRSNAGVIADGASEAVAFSGMTFTKVSPESGYTFTVTEQHVADDDSSKDGVQNGKWTMDAHTYTITIKVTDVNGQLTAAVTTDGDSTFTNTYEKDVVPPTPTDPTPVTWNMDPGLKVLTGRDLKAGEFTFELVDADGKVIDTTTNDANGNFRFDGITYDKEGAYTYTVREVNGGKVIDGVTYDDTIYTITVTVTEVNGKLVANTAITANGQTAADIVFRNAYEAKPAEDIEVDATKKLTGRDLKAGEFEFQLRDADGNVVATAKNGADGRIVFADLAFDKPGTYEYTLVEVAGNATGVTYDKSSHKVTITVTDDLKGQLIAEVAYDGGSAPVFTNTFTPDKPGENNENKTPGDGGTPDTTPGKTADTGAAVSGLVAFATGLLLAGVTLVGVRRRNSLGTARGHHLTK